MKVGVVIASRNRSQLLTKAIASLQRQSLQDLEIIVIDDCSDDDTQEVVGRLAASDTRVRYHRNEIRLGPSASRNIGISLASSDYIAIQDDDDVSSDDRMLKQKDLLDRRSDVSLVFSSVRWVDRGGQVLSVRPGIVVGGQFPETPQELLRLLIYEGNRVANGAIMFRRTLFIDIGGYPERYSIGEDWLWFMRMCLAGHVVHAIREPLVDVLRDHGHVRLMKNYKSAHVQQRNALKSIYSEMKLSRVENAYAVYRKALSNQFIREVSACGGWRGVWRGCMAVCLTPLDKDTYHRLYEVYAPFVRRRLLT